MASSSHSTRSVRLGVPLAYSAFAYFALTTIAGCASSPEAKAPASHDPVVLQGMAHACTEQSEAEACRIACEGGLFPSCSDLGHLYELGLNVPRDVIAASSYYRKGCDGGDMASCFNAAYVLENGIAGRRDAHCAVALYNYACDGGFARGCLVAGFMYKSGVDIEKDDARAAVFFKKACAAGNVSGCNQLKELSPSSPPTATAQ